jgi:hypothetical protein
MNNIPEDFDWQYYINIHPDLVKAKILTKKAAINHYLMYGRFEKREYKYNQTKNIKNYKTNSILDCKIILFVQWYLDKETEQNRKDCIINNINNQYIDHIHIFYETNSLENFKNQHFESNKISLSEINERLTYKYWLNYSYLYYPNDIKILINSDIYLLDDIKIFKSCIFDSTTLYVMTRKDQTPEGNIIISKENFNSNSVEINYIYSQDAWIFKDKIYQIDDIETNFCLGYENCDRIFKNNLIDKNIKIINFFPEVFCVHKDYRTIKHRPKYSL